jgi:hypothetical protein
MVAAVPGPSRSPLDEGSELLRSERRTHPDLVEQLVLRRLTAWFETVRPRDGCRRWRVRRGGACLGRVGQPIDEAERLGSDERSEERGIRRVVHVSCDNV